MLLWPSSQSSCLWRSGDQWSFSSDPSLGGSNGSLKSYCGYLPSSRMHNLNSIVSNWQNPYIGSLTCGVRAVMMAKAK